MTLTLTNLQNDYGHQLQFYVARCIGGGLLQDTTSENQFALKNSCVHHLLYSTYTPVLLGKGFTSFRKECSNFVYWKLFLVRCLFFLTCYNFALSRIQRYGIFKSQKCLFGDGTVFLRASKIVQILVDRTDFFHTEVSFF